MRRSIPMQAHYPSCWRALRFHSKYITSIRRISPISHRGRTGQLNGTYEGAYIVLLEMPDNADKNILNSRAELIEEGKDVACILKGGNVIAIVGYKE